MNYNSLIPELNVKDLQKSKYFYVNILGFKVEYERKEEGFTFLSLGNAQLMLDEIDTGRTWKTAAFEYPLGRGINLQIQVKNITPLLNALKKNNIPLFLEVEEKWYSKENVQVGNKQFLIQDPDGYLLRFFQDLGEKEL